MFEHYENYDRYIPDVMLKKHKKHEEYLNNAYAGMTHEEIYKSKLGTVDDALALIESGDVIVNSIHGSVCSIATSTGSPIASIPTTPWSCGPASTAGALSILFTPILLTRTSSITRPSSMTATSGRSIPPACPPISP